MTRAARWTAEPTGVVSVDQSGYVRPIGPGEATVTGTLGDDRATLKVTVADPAARAWSFGEDVIPKFR